MKQLINLLYRIVCYYQRVLLIKIFPYLIDQQLKTMNGRLTMAVTTDILAMIYKISCEK